MTTYRARRRSSAWEIMQKMEQRYDEEDSIGTVEQIANWINKVLEGKHEKFDFEPGEGVSWKNFKKFLRNGVALCKLINELLKDIDEPEVKFHTTNCDAPFRSLENIETFTKWAKEYGVPESSVFASADLYEGQKGPFIDVINCLNEVGILANNKGFEPRYEGVQTPTIDTDLWEKLNAMYSKAMTNGED